MLVTNPSHFSRNLYVNTINQAKRMLTIGTTVKIGELEVEIKKQLGKGVSKTVFAAVDPNTSIQYAVMKSEFLKKLFGSPALARMVYSKKTLEFFKKEVIAAIKRENEIKTMLGSHPNLDTEIIDSMENPTHLLVVKPLSDNTFTNFLKSGQASFPIVIKLMLDVLSGLEHMHQCDIIHADIKPDNLLIHKNSAILSDFGVSTPIGNESPLLGDEDYRDHLADVLDVECDVYAFLLTLADIFYSNNWKGENAQQNELIDGFKSDINKAILGPREYRPNLGDIRQKMESILKQAESLGEFNTVGDNTIFFDSKVRDTIIDRKGTFSRTGE